MYEGETFYIVSLRRTAMVALMDEDKGISIVDYDTGEVLLCLLNPTDYEGIALLNNTTVAVVKDRSRGKIRSRKKKYRDQFKAIKSSVASATAMGMIAHLRLPNDTDCSTSKELAQVVCPAKRL